MALRYGAKCPATKASTHPVSEIMVRSIDIALLSSEEKELLHSSMVGAAPEAGGISSFIQPQTIVLR